MKKIAYICTLMIFIISCTNPSSRNFATIKGKIISGNIKEVKFEWIRDNSISEKANRYVANVDTNAEFSIQIPINKLATGRITTGRYYHEICLIPGDNFNITINGDSISYSGKGGEKNNYLFSEEKCGLWDRSYYNESNKSQLTPSDFVTCMKDFKQKRLDFLNSYPQKLQKEFLDYYRIENQVIYEDLIQGYPRRYAYKNRTYPDSLELPDEYRRLAQISNFMDDKKVISHNYIRNFRNFLFTKARKISNSDSSLNFSDAIYVTLFDSLQGKTQEYVLAKWICSKLSYNKNDTIAYNRFLEIAKDEIPKAAVSTAFNKYREKQDLIGKPLHTELAQTVLVDTANVEITFKDMIDKYKGRVVYLDLWSLGCGPCRATMPYSKKLKEYLKEQPIEFIYITVDGYNNKLWDNIFKVSLTHKNQYRFKNGFNSRLHQFLEINWVPCYMIFDKKGNLINFNADRPSRLVGKVETKLVKKLKELAVE